MADEPEERPERYPLPWNGGSKWIVRGIHGAIVGTMFIYMGNGFAETLLADGNLTAIEAGFLGVVFLCGAMGSVPWVFMPVLYRVINAWQSRKGVK